MRFLFFVLLFLYIFPLQSQTIEISTWEELNNIRENLSAKYLLKGNLGPESPGYHTYADSTANGGAGWLPIDGFTGELDGGNFIIDGLTVNRTTDNAGFFGEASSGSPKVVNIGFTNAEIVTQGDNAGVIFGSIITGATPFMENLFVSGKVQANNNAGGLVGFVEGFPSSNPRLATNVYSLASITATISNAGGFIGKLTQGQGYLNVSNSYVAGRRIKAVLQESTDGGIIGHIDGTLTNLFEHVFWDGEISGQSSTAGSLGEYRSSDQMRKTANNNMTGLNFVDVWYHSSATPNPPSEFEPFSSAYPVLRTLDFKAQYLAQIEPMIILASTSTTDVPFTLRFGVNHDVYIQTSAGDARSKLAESKLVSINLPSATDYTIKVYGSGSEFGFGSENPAASQDAITQVTTFGDIEFTSLSGLFSGATNLVQVPEALPSMVSNLSFMFRGASSFNQNIASWRTENVTTMQSMFEGATAFNQDIGGWNTGIVTTMQSMFEGATSFNQDIGDWVTLNVTTMQSMFERATSFNQDIGGWDTGKVTTMESMFENATSFNQKIGNWYLFELRDAQDMLLGVTLSNENYSDLLLGWSSQGLKSGVKFHGGNSKYLLGSDANAARNNLINPPTSGGFGWEIIDGGPVLPDAVVWSIPETVIFKQNFAAAAEFRLNNAIYPVSGRVTITASSGSGILSGILASQATNGLVIFNTLSISQLGDYKLSISWDYIEVGETKSYTNESPSINVTSIFAGGSGRGDTMQEATDQGLLPVFVWKGEESGKERDWLTFSNWTIPKNFIEIITASPDGSPEQVIRIPGVSNQPILTASGSVPMVDIRGKLTLQDQSSVTISEGSIFKISSGANVISEGSGRIIIEPDAVYLNESVNEPTLEVQQRITGEKGWRMLGTPLKDITYSNLLTGLAPQGIGGLSSPLNDSRLQPNVLWFDETDGGTTLQSWRKPSNVGNTVGLGLGHYVYVFNGESIPNGLGNYGDRLPVTLKVTGKEHNFLNQGPVNFGITYTPRTSAFIPNDTQEDAYIETNPADAGFNMVANPTASVIDFYHPDAWTKTNLDNTIYVWDPSLNNFSGSWRVFNGLEGNLENGRIAPYQAFWVRANAENPSLSLNSSEAKALLPKPYYSRTLESEKSNDNSQILTLSLQVNGEGLKAESWLSFDPNGRQGQDPKDAYQLESLSDNWLLLYTYGSQNHRTPLQINNQDFLNGEEKSIPLMLAAAKSDKEFSGNYTLSWKVPENWPEGISLTLMDHTKERAIDMLDRESYGFVFDAPKNPGARVNIHRSGMKSPGPVIFDSPFASGDPNARTTRPDLSKRPFTIRIGSIQEGKGLDYLPDFPKLYAPFPNPFSREVKIQFYIPYAMTAQVRITDLSGRVVRDFGMKDYSGGTHELEFVDEAMSLGSGVYLVLLQTKDNLLNQKLIKIN